MDFKQKTQGNPHSYHNEHGHHPKRSMTISRPVKSFRQYRHQDITSTSVAMISHRVFQISQLLMEPGKKCFSCFSFCTLTGSQEGIVCFLAEFLPSLHGRAWLIVRHSLSSCRISSWSSWWILVHWNAWFAFLVGLFLNLMTDHGSCEVVVCLLTYHSTLQYKFKSGIVLSPGLPFCPELVLLCQVSSGFKWVIRGLLSNLWGMLLIFWWELH